MLIFSARAFRLPNCFSESALVARACFAARSSRRCLPGNEQGEQHGEKAFARPLHAGPDQGDGVRDKAEEGAFPVVEPALFGLEPLHQLLPFPRFFPVAEALDGEGQGMAVAFVFIDLVDLELMPRPDRLAGGAVVVPEGALLVPAAFEGIVLGLFQAALVGPHIGLDGPRPFLGVRGCHWRWRP